MAQTAPTLNKTGSGTATTVTIPSGTVVGDMMLLRVYFLGTLTTPTGWTSVATGATGSPPAGWAVLSRRAVAGDPGSTFTLAGTLFTLFAWQIATWSNVGGDPFVIGTAAETTSSGTTGSVTPTTITTTDANSTVISCYFGTAYYAGGFSVAASITLPATQVQSGSGGFANAGEGYDWAFGASYTAQATAGTSTASSASFTFQFSEPYQLAAVQIALPPLQAPSVPTLLMPANASFVDVSDGLEATWTYNPTTNDGAQAAIAFRRKTSGAYEYWNNGTSAWQSTIVWNSWTTQTITFPSSAWSNGNIYNWSVATQEATESLQGSFATDSTLTAQALPTATVTAPSGTITSFTPTVTWSETVASGAAQTGYQVILYTAAQVAAGGFAPGSGPDVYDTGVVSSADTSWTVPAALLSNNVTYYVYLQVIETGGEASAWASSAFTVSVDAPAAPSLTVTPDTDPDTGCPRMAIVVQGHDNILTALDASFEGSVGTWQASTNTTIAASTDQAVDGSYSLAITATATGNAGAFTSVSALYDVQPSTAYTILASLKAKTTGRSCELEIFWRDSSGAAISSDTITVTDSTSGWTTATIHATSPSNAAKAFIEVVAESCAAGEVHYVDCAGISPGTVTTWTRGGLVGSTSATVSYTDPDNPTSTNLRDMPVTLDTGTQQATVYDYEAGFGVTRAYTAIIGVPALGIYSPTSTPAAGTLSDTDLWVSDPLDTTVAVPLLRATALGLGAGPLQKTTSEAMGVFSGFGNPTPIIQRGTVTKPTFTVDVVVEGYENHETLLDLVGRGVNERKSVLLFRFPNGDSWYVVVGPQVTGGPMDTAAALVDPLFELSLPCVTVGRP